MWLHSRAAGLGFHWPESLTKIFASRTARTLSPPAPPAGATFISNVASGNWNAAGSWTLISGSDGDGIPDSDDDVYIQAGHTMTLVQNEACNDLDISTGTTDATTGGDGRVALGANTLQVNGKLRSYFATVGTTPGTDSTTLPSSPITITASSAGKLSFVGNSRNITNTGQWAAGNTGATTTFAVEINLISGQTATMQTGVKASSWSVISGTLDAGSNVISADNGTNGQADITIGANGTVISAQSGTSNNVFQRSGSSLAGTLTANGLLQLSGTSPNISVSAINFNSTVEYTKSGVQTLAVANNSGASPSTYTNLKLSGSSTKTLGLNTTVNGTLARAGTASLSLGAFVLTYGGSSTLEYAGSGTQTTTDTEFPSLGGPNSLKINNSNGVSLHAARSVNGTLTLTSGNVTTTATNLLTVSNTSASAISGGSSSSYINGPLARVLPASLASGSTYSFPVGKGGFNAFEMVNPTTTSGGTVTIQAEEFDANSVGTPGTGLSSLNTDRYWQGQITANSGNFTNTSVRLTDSGLTTAKRIGKAAAANGTYDSIGGTVSGSTITSNTITSFGFFNIGTVSSPGAIQFALANTDTPEGDTGSHTVDIHVQRVGGVGGPVSVNYSVTDGTATTADIDYSVSPASGTLIWANNDSADKIITVTVNGDDKFEADETVNLAISNPTNGATLGAQSTATLTIKNDDSQPKATIGNVTQAEGSSGPNDFTFAVTLSNPSASDVTITYSTHDGTATAGDDYTAINNGLLTIPATQTSGTFNVSVNGDTTYEANETFTVTLDSATGATIGSSSTGTGIIQNDDAPPATLIVNTTADHDDGFCLPLSSGDCTLREAINAANFDNSDLNTIAFDIPANDPRHFYYGNNIAAGVAAANVTPTTAAADPALSATIDPDYPHSWWSIAPTSPLPEIAATVTIDGYTQRPCSTPNSSPCSQANTLGNGDDAELSIELSGANIVGLGADGLFVTAGSGPDPVGGSMITGLVINHFSGNGIKLTTTGGTFSSGNQIIGNFIGTDVSGTLAAANNVGLYVDNTAGNKIGCTTPDERNVISGNTDEGIEIYGMGPNFNATLNLVQGNFIGTDRTGLIDLGNGSDGVKIYDGFGNTVGVDSNSILPSGGNVISGNGSHGVEIATGTCTGMTTQPGNFVQGNFIGTDIAGTVNLGNTGNGVAIYDAPNNIIGNTASGFGNLIANNGGNGVLVEETISPVNPASNNSIRGNSIFSSGALGIDLTPNSAPAVGTGDGVTPNDPGGGDGDAGPNSLQNFPESLSASATGGPTSTGTISGTLNSNPGNFTIDFYSNSACDSPSGYGEGQTYLDSYLITIDSSGSVTFTSNSLPISPGDHVTATATDANGNTSEFSLCITVGQAVQSTTTTITNASDLATNTTFADPFTVKWSVTHSGPGTPTGMVTVNIAASTEGCSAPVADGQCAVTPTSAGTKQLSATYAGDTNFTGSSSSPPLPHTVDKSNQTITFNPNPLPNKTFGDPDFTVTATASSGLTVTFTPTGNCTMSGNMVHLTGAGSCTITASQAGNANFNSAPDVARPFSIAKANQTITFNALANKTFGDADFNVSASATSGLAVSFSASSQCTVTGATVHLTGAGPCTIAASQGGDSNYNAAGLSQSFDIAKAATTTAMSSSANPSDSGQSVTFTATVTSTAGTPTGTVQFRDGANNLGSAVNCVAGGGNSCTAQSVPTSALTVGTHTITADYSGDTNFFASSGTLSGGQVVKSQPSLSINDVSITEGDSGTKTLDLAVKLSAASDLTVTVDFATANGTASAPSDYIAIPLTTLTFNPGDTTKTISVIISGDQSFEPNEAFTVNLTNPVNSTISKAQGVGTILNDDAQGGIISFSQSNYSINESGRFITITVNRTGDTSGPATVAYATPDDSESSTVVPCATTNGIASPRCDFTSALGTLRFAASETSKTFTVLISQDNYVEGPESLTLALSNLTGGAVFGAPSTATVEIADDATEPATNPIDDAQNFVRQHYHDFLNREPDTDGLNFWTNEITSCGTDPQCIEVKHINVSAAFYLSIEFQDTGYLVERMYKASYGDASGTSTIGGAHQLPVPIIRFKEFLPDTQQIGQGVVVRQTGWETVLDNNKAAFAAQFVQRSRFATAYPNTLTPAQFVDMLFANTGVTPSSTDRQAAISEFGGAGTSADAAARGRALRRVAENGTFAQTEFNRAFVLMQYFGYLRRNPDVAPDPDHSGYDFWLTRLNQFNGNFVNAEMVKAFITSDEYRHRFGP
jgi:CSLREA domain-containing protein